MQVALRARKMLMAQVGGQQWEFCIEFCPLPIPTHQGMDCKGVAQIMDARSLPSAGMRYPTHEQQVTEEAVHRPQALWSTVRCREEEGLRRAWATMGRVRA